MGSFSALLETLNFPSLLLWVGQSHNLLSKLGQTDNERGATGNDAEATGIWQEQPSSLGCAATLILGPYLFFLPLSQGSTFHSHGFKHPHPSDELSIRHLYLNLSWVSYRSVKPNISIMSSSSPHSNLFFMFSTNVPHPLTYPVWETRHRAPSSVVLTCNHQLFSSTVVKVLTCI